MAWEQRANKFYYYRSVRRGKRVRKEYFGGTDVGLLAAEMQANRKARRQAKQDREKALLLQLKSLDGQLDQLENLAKTLAAEALYSAGFYRHGREWRKRKRWPKPTSSES